jgi:hypothetical protein
VTDPNIIRLIVTATTLSLAHNIDHAVRGDFDPAKGSEAVGGLIVSAVIYTIIGTGLWLYTRGRAGPRFWCLFSLFGLAFGWFAHFSPFTDQPVSYIYGAYPVPAEGGIAVAFLFALMFSLLAAAIYTGYRWIKGYPE